MVERKSIGKTPREHFMRTAEDEFAKFMRKELEFQRADRKERALRLGLPVATTDRMSIGDRGRKTIERN
jgi:hypothetical protein